MPNAFPAGSRNAPVSMWSSTATGPYTRDPPSSYLRRIHADTLLFSEPALRLTIEAFGADRVMFGTDWPPVSVPTSLTLDLVRGLDVPDDVRDGILGGNAVRLLRLAPH